MLLDPRTKFFIFITIIVIGMKGGLIPSIAALMLLVIALSFEQSGFTQFLDKSKYFYFLVLLTFLFHILFNITLLGGDGDPFSLEALKKAVFFSTRVFILVSAGSYFLISVEPTELAESLRTLSKPLQKLHIPVEELILMFLLTLSFVPIIAEQATRIKEAQAARGISGGKSLTDRVKRTIPVIAPLFLLSLERADRLALVLESRGYTDPSKRTFYNRQLFNTNDYFITLTCIVIMVYI